MHVLARILPVELIATKNIFISAVRIATSIDPPCPIWENKLRVSAQEQVEYMLGDDDYMKLIAADDEVKLEIRTALSRIFSLFGKELSLLPESSDNTDEVTEDKILQSLSDLEWMWRILVKMSITDDFVLNWIEISETLIQKIEDMRLEYVTWVFKVKIMEVTSKVLDAVGYGNVIVPAPRRVQLLQAWLPYVGKLKHMLDMMAEKDTEFHHKIDEDLWQSIEGAIVALVSALPSNDQAHIIAEWLSNGRLQYPDLSEAFEIWCFRTKSARRRLHAGASDTVDQNQDTDA